MTVVADENKRLLLPAAQPGDRFDLHIAGAGRYVLTKIAAATAPSNSVTIEKRGRFTVGVLNRPIDETAFSDALRE